MEQKGSFIGFTFGNRHSSELGIFRTSFSDRYNTSMIATTNVYSKRDIPISFAFYGLSEEQLIQLKQIFDDKKIHSLILDEEPYKVWSAKLTGMMVVKHLCFEHGASHFYCGEGTFAFTTFFPFARSRYQYAEDYNKENVRERIDDPGFTSENSLTIIQPAILTYDFNNEEFEEGSGYIITFEEWLDEQSLFVDSSVSLESINLSLDAFQDYNTYDNQEYWIESSLIPKRADGYGSYIPADEDYKEGPGRYKLYNAGDVEASFKIYFTVNNKAKNFEIECGNKHICLQNVISQNNDHYIVLDSHTLAVQGCDINYNKTKNLYNEYITTGNLFKLPIGELELISSEKGMLEFNYLYL